MPILVSMRCSPHARGGHSWAGGREAVALVPGVPPVAVQPDLPLRPDNLPEGEHLQPGQGVVHQLVPRGVHVGIVPCHWGGFRLYLVLGLSPDCLVPTWVGVVNKDTFGPSIATT